MFWLMIGKALAYDWLVLLIFACVERYKVEDGGRECVAEQRGSDFSVWIFFYKFFENFKLYI